MILQNLWKPKSMMVKYLINENPCKIKLLKFSMDVKKNKTFLIQVYNKLYPAGVRPSISYGLCKIHKGIVDGVPPILPVLWAIGIPT